MGIWSGERDVAVRAAARKNAAGGCVSSDGEAMTSHAPHPTPYPEVNAVLQAVLVGVRPLLGARLVGMYVHGSLASGDFNPQRSDIDFVVVTAGELPDGLLAALAAMHAQIYASGLPWATRMEGSYIPQQAIRRYDPAHARHPALRTDGSFELDQHSSDWVIQRHILREHGLVLVGPDPRTLIDPLQPDDLQRAVVGVLHEWWAPQLHDHTRLRHSDYQAYAVLTMCRARYTLAHGAVASKPVAARWAQAALDARWAALIERSLAWRPGMQLDELEATLALIRSTLEQADQHARLLERP